MSDFLIVGGGVIGLLMARELSGAGAQVTLVERGTCFREASWAGGGIVSPLYPWRYSDAVTALAEWAQEYYPALSQSLLEETGIDPQLLRTGLIMLDPIDEAEALAWALRRHKKMSLLHSRDVYERESGLAEGFRGGLWMPDIANVRNPRLGKALLASLRADRNVLIREHCDVLGIEHKGPVVTGLTASEGAKSESFSADNYIVTTGAWAGSLIKRGAQPLPVEPVKGQMLLYKSAERLLHSIVLHAGRYIIPRLDGHLLVGSTLEKSDFDKSLTQEALVSLSSSAAAMLPALARMKPIRQWAGLRPAAPDGIPFIGQVPEFDNLYVNAGHYRNGLVLAPASARLLADVLLRRSPAIDPTPYRIPELGTGV